MQSTTEKREREKRRVSEKRKKKNIKNGTNNRFM